jgi:hypothetical protein
MNKPVTKKEVKDLKVGESITHKEPNRSIRRRSMRNMTSMRGMTTQLVKGKTITKVVDPDTQQTEEKVYSDRIVHHDPKVTRLNKFVNFFRNLKVEEGVITQKVMQFFN